MNFRLQLFRRCKSSMSSSTHQPAAHLTTRNIRHSTPMMCNWWNLLQARLLGWLKKKTKTFVCMDEGRARQFHARLFASRSGFYHSETSKMYERRFRLSTTMERQIRRARESLKSEANDWCADYVSNDISGDGRIVSLLGLQIPAEFGTRTKFNYQSWGNQNSTSSRDDDLDALWAIQARESRKVSKLPRRIKLAIRSWIWTSPMKRKTGFDDCMSWVGNFVVSWATIECSRRFGTEDVRIVEICDGKLWIF